MLPALTHSIPVPVSHYPATLERPGSGWVYVVPSSPSDRGFSSLLWWRPYWSNILYHSRSRSERDPRRVANNSTPSFQFFNHMLEPQGKTQTIFSCSKENLLALGGVLVESDQTSFKISIYVHTVQYPLKVYTLLEESSHLKMYKIGLFFPTVLQYLQHFQSEHFLNIFFYKNMSWLYKSSHPRVFFLQI